MKLGPWQDRDIKPRNGPGQYQRRMPSGLLLRSHWTGQYWCAGGTVTRRSLFQNLPWRGLTVDPTVKSR